MAESPSVSPEAIRALSAQWRKEADDYHRRMHLNAAAHHEVGEASCRASMVIHRKCADELDALLLPGTDGQTTKGSER